MQKPHFKTKILTIILFLFLLGITIYKFQEAKAQATLASGSDFNIYFADSTLTFQAYSDIDFECTTGVWNGINSTLLLKRDSGTLSFIPLDSCTINISTVADRDFQVDCSGAGLIETEGSYGLTVTGSESGWTTPTTIHSKCGETGGSEATLAIDDNIGTDWQHQAICSHWIIFDMGETRTRTKIQIYQSDIAINRWGRSSGLYVYVGDDPANLGDAVWEGVLDDSGWQESGAFKKEGRYVKLASKSSSDSQQMYEFDVYTSPCPRVTITWRYLPWSMIDNYFMLGVGLTGIVMLIVGPTWFARTFVKHGLDSDSIEHLGYAMLFVVLGFGFLVIWLWPG